MIRRYKLQDNWNQRWADQVSHMSFCNTLIKGYAWTPACFKIYDLSSSTRICGRKENTVGKTADQYCSYIASQCNSFYNISFYSFSCTATLYCVGCPWHALVFGTYLLIHWKLYANSHCDIGFVSHETDDQSYEIYLQSNNRHAGGHLTLKSAFENVGEEPTCNIIMTYASSNVPLQKAGGAAVIFSPGNGWKCISHSIFCSE